MAPIKMTQEEKEAVKAAKIAEKEIEKAKKIAEKEIEKAKKIAEKEAVKAAKIAEKEAVKAKKIEDTASIKEAKKIAKKNNDDNSIKNSETPTNVYTILIEEVSNGTTRMPSISVFADTDSLVKGIRKIYKKFVDETKDNSDDLKFVNKPPTAKKLDDHFKEFDEITLAEIGTLIGDTQFGCRITIEKHDVIM
jgi:hypothetical protein